LLEIFKHISHETLIGSIRRTCKLWNQLSHENVLWREISVSHFPNHRLSSTSFLELLTKVSHCVEVLTIDLHVLNCDVIEHEGIYCKKLKELCLKRSQRTVVQVKQHLLTFASKYPNLKTLKICGCSCFLSQSSGKEQERENGYAPECSMFPHLNSLSLQTTVVNKDALFWFLSCHKYLKDLAFIDTSIDDEKLVHIVTLLQELEVLDLRGSIQFVDSEKVASSLAGKGNCFRSLRSLNLDSCCLDDKILNVFVCESATLECVSLRYTTGITDIGLETVVNSCPELKGLFLDLFKSPSNVTDAGLESVFKKCQHLEQVALDNCKILTDISILTLAEHFKSLREINVVSCLNLTDKSIIKLVECCPNLACVNVSYCYQLSEKSISTVLKGCKCLQRLSAMGLNRVKDLKLRGNTGLPVPKVTDMRRNYTVVNEHLQHEQEFPNVEMFSADEKCYQKEKPVTVCHSQGSILDELSYHSHVKSLDLSYCSALTNDDVKQIAKFCKDLRVLKFQACPIVSDVAIKEIIQVCVFLKRLCISGGSISQTSLLTNTCLYDIAKYGSNLESLTLVKNSNITADGVFEVVKNVQRYNKST